MGALGQSKVLAVIPARYASTRFPGKVLADIGGKPLVWHVYDRTCRAELVTETVVATDDEHVARALEPLGVPVVMTRTDHVSGTDRVAEVARNSDAAIIINVQGDEPLIDPKTIDATLRPLLDDASIPMATARRRITDPARVTDPNTVKVVCAPNGRALYFSRSPIPFVREAGAAESCHWQHVGIYAYRRDFLLRYAELPTTPLEGLEKLEQLRVLENGYPIAVIETEYESIGVDTPEDLERVLAHLRGTLKGDG
ncbi:MAG: 3-deoxy-manno-octulosonate cytidylyltransferase [FCB group bacterium]|jgi:3-deoxy-manno-octulosonate cytidylyltransferase (CMP-KDO synthetase)|nr:3-deoxy-manno-octulosonate cytidylyltransferase [FCB group bacterium]